MTALPVLYKVITLQNLHSLYIQSYQRQEKEITLDMDKLRSSINASPLIDPAYDLCQIDTQKVQKDNQTSQVISGEQIVEIINEFFSENGGQALIPISTNVFKISETISINTIKDRLIKVLNHYKNTTLREVAALEAQYHLLRTQKEKVIASEVLKEDEDESIDEVEDNKPEDAENARKDFKVDEPQEEQQEEDEKSLAPKEPSKSELSNGGEFANGSKEEENMEQAEILKEEDTSVEEHRENKNEEPVKELEETENTKDENTEKKVESTAESQIEQQRDVDVKSEKADAEISEKSDLSEKTEENHPEKEELVDSTFNSEIQPTETIDRDQQMVADKTKQDQAIGEGKPIDNDFDGNSSSKEKSSEVISETPNGESNPEKSQDEDNNQEANATEESPEESPEEQESQPEESRAEEKLSVETTDDKRLLDRESPSKEAERKRSHDADESEQEISPSKRQKKEDTQKSIKKFQTIASNLISQISSNRFASTFLAPVNKSEEPEYYKIVKQPQDLKTILKHCRNGEITTFDELTKVLQIMFTNAIIYNDEDSDVSKLTIEMMEETTKIIELFRESLD
ncbi:hypothetical protein LJB42_002907 [Komagataella kurtzmanii]|nr:hypothetical protein LJB42_002907 [Komagataella kurtzmanii]